MKLLFSFLIIIAGITFLGIGIFFIIFAVKALNTNQFSFIYLIASASCAVIYIVTGVAAVITNRIFYCITPKSIDK